MNLSTEGSPPRPTPMQPEIQALRALAVALVVVFHLFPTGLRGGFIGVDVFFVISGFLITRQIAQELAAGTFSFRNFFARRARRLLPAAGLVLATVMLVTWAFRPRFQWQATIEGIWGSTFYVQNWVLARSATDYFNDAPTAVQHFWSLSVEEQFYFVWPSLLAALARGSNTKRQIVGLSVVVLASFVASIFTFRSAPEFSYFATHVRAWEFGVGGLLVFAPRFRAEALGAKIASLVGFVVLCVAAWLLDEAKLFAGWPLLPVVGSALVLVAGTPETRSWRGAVFRFPAVRYLGDVSYSLYLWHWPFLVWMDQDFPDAPPWIRVSGILAASLSCAALTRHFIEEPLRLRSHARANARESTRDARSVWAYGSIAALLFVSLGTSGWAWQQLRSDERVAEAFAKKLGKKAGVCVGADALRSPSCPPSRSTEFTPPLEGSQREFYQLEDVGYRDCFVKQTKTGIKLCHRGKSDARHHVALVGDSHALQWAPAMTALVERGDLRVTMAFRGSCPFNLARVIDGTQKECGIWIDRVLDELARDESIDLVVTTSFADKRFESAPGSDMFEAAVQGYVETWERLGLKGKRPVLALRDTPLPRRGYRECLSKREPLEQCGQSRKTASKHWKGELGKRGDPVRAAIERSRQARYHYVDLTSSFCTADQCLPVVGNVLVYGDNHHITPTYARSLAPDLAQVVTKYLE